MSRGLASLAAGAPITTHTDEGRYGDDQQAFLTGHGVHFQRGFPDKLAPASIYFGETAEELDHKEFMSQAWAPDPLRWVLERVGQFRG